MKYYELYELLDRQNKRFQQLEQDILYNINELREIIEKTIGAPETVWEMPNTGERGRYIDTALFAEGLPALNISNIKDSPIENGVLLFAVKIGLAPAENKFPIHYFHRKFGIKYKDMKPLFSISNGADGELENWEEDKGKVAADLIEMLTDYLKYDPFEGPQDKSKIGFGLVDVK